MTKPRVDYKNFSCSVCGSYKTYIKKSNKRPEWYYHNGGKPICKYCYFRIYVSPKYNPRTHAKWNPILSKQRILFLGKQIYIKWKKLTGYCSKCPNNIYDGSCKATQLHHYFYLSCMPWACTDERCAKCHGEETIKTTLERKGFYR